MFASLFGQKAPFEVRNGENEALLSSSVVVTRPFHDEYDAAREEQTFLLADGRTLGFAEYGSRSLTAVAVFALHGAPGCRYDAIDYDKSAKKLDVRLVCVDRPGHGLSTHDPNRRLVDHASEISQLAKHLGIERYHVFGQSGGGPFVIACAYAIPEHELLNATVVAGFGPPETVTIRDAGFSTVLTLWLHYRMPGLLSKFTKWQYSPKFLNNDEAVQKELNRAYRVFNEEDRRVIAAPDRQPAIRAVLREAFRQGGDGPIRDGQIYVDKQLWGLDLKDVKKRVQLVFACEDNRATLAMGRYYHKHLPKSTLWEIEGVGHITLETKYDEILAHIIGKDLPVEESDT